MGRPTIKVMATRTQGIHQASGTKPPKRRRINPQERREEILEAATRLIGRGPVEDVSIEAVAREAGASRALIYHHFESKADLFRAVVQHAGDQLRSSIASQVVPGMSPQAAVAIYLDYAETHAAGFKALHEGSLGTDPQIRAITRRSHEQYVDITLQAMGMDASNPVARLSVQGWHSYVVTVCVEWLNNPELGRETVEQSLLTSFALLKTGLSATTEPCADDEQPASRALG